MLGLIFLIIGIFVSFWVNIYIGILIIVLSLLFSIFRKYKDLFIAFVIVLNSLALIIVPVVYYFIHKTKTVNNDEMLKYEEMLVSKAKEYAQNKKYYDDIELSPNTILTSLELGVSKSGCQEYVIYNSKIDVKAYIKCDNYVTKGYDSNNLK